MINWRSVFGDNGLDVMYRCDDKLLYASAYSHLSYQPVSYLSSAIDYQLAYQRGHGGDWEDISCILRQDNKDIAIWPLTISSCNGVAALNSQGQPVCPPIFAAECSANTKKKYTLKCFQIANEIAIKLGIDEWQSMSSCAESNGVSEWQIQAMSQGARCVVRHDLYVDLSLSLSDIKSRFRKSYRSLVTSGDRLWKVEILRAPGSITIWQEFRELHAEVAGRITRSLESWQIQHEAIQADEGFLVVLRDSENRMVGAGYFVHSTDEASYAVGAYDRNLFDKPLGHVVQFHAIQELQRRGCRWYRIGNRSFTGDFPSPSQKELSISYFKQGFCTHVYPVFLLNHLISLENL